MSDEPITSNESAPETPIKEDAYPSSLIDKANQAAERLEKGNEELLKLIERQEQLKVETTLGGQTVAGQEEPKEETPTEYMKKVLNNTK